MKKLNVDNLVKQIKQGTIKHSPGILIGIGIAGMVGASVKAVMDTPKAMKLIEEKKKELNKEKLTPVETVCTAGPVYIPAIITGGLGIAAILGGNSVNVKRNAVLATAIGLKDTALKELKTATIETVGEKQAEAIQDKMAKNRLDNSGYSSRDIIVTGKGKTHFYDAVTDTPFDSDMEAVKSAINKINYRLMSEMYISVNELYYELGIKQLNLGDDIGWHIDNGLIEPLFSAQISDTGEPVIVIEYTIGPRYDYRKSTIL